MDNAEYPGAVCPYDVDWASPTRPAHPGRDIFAGARGILCQNIAQTATRTGDTGIPHRPCAIHVMQDTVCTGQFIFNAEPDRRYAASSTGPVWRLTSPWAGNP